MEQDQPKTEKKIWVEPQLTYMPMKNINSFHNAHIHEIVNTGNDDTYEVGS